MCGWHMFIYTARARQTQFDHAQQRVCVLVDVQHMPPPCETARRVSLRYPIQNEIKTMPFKVFVLFYNMMNEYPGYINIIKMNVGYNFLKNVMQQLDELSTTPPDGHQAIHALELVLGIDDP